MPENAYHNDNSKRQSWRLSALSAPSGLSAQQRAAGLDAGEKEQEASRKKGSVTQAERAKKA